MSIICSSQVFLSASNLPNPTKSDHGFCQMRALLNPMLWHTSRAHPLFPVFHVNIETPFLVLCDDSIQESLFVATCCSVPGKMLSSNGKPVFFVLLSQPVGNPSSKFLGKSHHLKMIDNCWLGAIHLHSQFLTGLITVLQKYLQMVLVKLGRSTRVRSIV